MEHTPRSDVRTQLGADAGSPYSEFGRSPLRCRLWGWLARFFESFKKRHSDGDRQDEGARALKTGASRMDDGPRRSDWFIPRGPRSVSLNIVPYDRAQARKTRKERKR
jgi:hypothetical protein